MNIKYLLSVFFLIVLYNDSYSCECSGQTLENEIATANSIFIGKAISIDSIALESNGKTLKYSKVLFDLNENFKGVLDKQIVVIAETTGSMCDARFIQGSTYLVFARLTTLDNSLNNEIHLTESCSRTALANFRIDNIRKLRKLKNEIENIDKISAKELYEDIWKDEVFSHPEQRAKLILTTKEEQILLEEKLKSCPVDSVFPLNGMDSILFELGHWDYTPSVHVLFNINQNGKLSKFKVFDSKGLPSTCIENALRFVKELKHWKPASIRGVNVKSEWGYVVDFSKTKSR